MTFYKLLPVDFLRRAVSHKMIRITTDKSSEKIHHGEITFYRRYFLTLPGFILLSSATTISVLIFAPSILVCV